MKVLSNIHRGWVVVMAAWLLFVVEFGIMYSYGLFFIEFQREFHSSATLTGWAGAIPLAFTILLAPPMQVIIDRFGHRPVAVVCIVISSSGVVATSFVPSMPLVYLTYSLMYGGAAGAVALVSTFLILRCFPSRNCVRALAFALSGANIGMFVFAPLLTFLFDRFGWRNTLRILGAAYFTVGICCVANYVLPPTAPSTSKNHKVGICSQSNGVKCNGEIRRDTEDQENDDHARNVDLYSANGLSTDHFDDERGEKTHFLADENCAQESINRDDSDRTSTTDCHNQLVEKKFERSSTDFQEDHTLGHSRCQVMAYPELWMICVAVVITGALDCFLYVNMVSYMVSVGFTETDGSRFLTVMGASTAVGKLVLAFVGELLPFPSYYLLVVTPIISCVIMGSLLVIRSLAAMLFLGVFIGGVMIPITGVLINVIANSIFGPERSRYTHPIILFSNGVGYLFGSLIGQSIDRTGSYRIAIFISLGLYVIGSVLLTAAPLYQRTFAPDRYVLPEFHRLTRSKESTGSQKQDADVSEVKRIELEATYERVTSV